MRWARLVAMLSMLVLAGGCGRLLGFGSDDDEAIPPAADPDAAAPPLDGSVTAEGASGVDDAGVVVAPADAADVTVAADGRACTRAGSCAASVFDCCSEMEDPSAAMCAGLCGVDICCN